MDGGNAQGATLLGNDAVRSFFEFLIRERLDAGQAYSVMIAQVEGMEDRFQAAILAPMCAPAAEKVQRAQEAAI